MLVNASAEQRKAEAVPAPKWHLRAVRVQQRAPPGQCSSRDGTDGLAASAGAGGSVSSDGREASGFPTHAGDERPPPVRPPALWEWTDSELACLVLLTIYF